MVNWATQNYGTDPNRIYATGQSMGGWGSVSYAFHRPDIFAAVFPILPRFTHSSVPNLTTKTYSVITPSSPLMPDQTTSYSSKMDSITFASQTHSDLPFIGWAIGRNDAYAPWTTQVAMVNALERNHHGYAFSWNNGDHTTGANAMTPILQMYDGKFRKNVSYPAFSQSSINSNMGNGDLSTGDTSGGMNLGFEWTTPIDTRDNWSVGISNNLIPVSQSSMTVTVTPRRTQNFDPSPGEVINYSTSGSQSGSVVTDSYGLVTIRNIILQKNATTTISLTNTHVPSSLPDVNQPTTPASLVATVISSNRVDLSWNASTDDSGVAGYVIYRNAQQIATTSLTNFSDPSLLPSTNYTYTVFAYDSASNISDQSNIAYATTWANASGLVARWTMNNDSITPTLVNDVSGNNNNLTKIGSPTTTPSGRIAEAIVLNGQNQYLQASSSSSITPLSAMSMSAWVYTSSGSTAAENIISKSKNSWSYSMHVSKTGQTFNCRFTITSAPTYIDLSWPGGVNGLQPYLNQWNLVTCTYDGAQAKMYVNGVLRNTKNNPGVLAQNSEDIIIGNKLPNNYYFNGKIDDVRIYNKALTPQDVTDIFNLVQ